jgi:hypothetical protein
MYRAMLMVIKVAQQGRQNPGWEDGMHPRPGENPAPGTALMAKQEMHG